MASNDQRQTALDGNNRSANPTHESAQHGTEGSQTNEYFGGPPRSSEGGPWSFEGMPRSRRRRRPQSPSLHWREPHDPKHGRVLVIDYCPTDPSKANMRKVTALEVSDFQQLQKNYGSQSSMKTALRIFHVQNAAWATYWLLGKYGIQESSFESRTSFREWVTQKGPKRRAGKALMNGRTFNTQDDPMRGISRTAFGLDYLKQYPRRAPDDGVKESNAQRQTNESLPMMELNAYDSEDNPMPTYDVYVQRLSVYIQYKDLSAKAASDSKASDTGNKTETAKTDAHLKKFPQGQEPDNGNVIIIFDNSHSGSISDTLIVARREWESKWRRLPFYLSYESVDITSDNRLAIECMKIVTGDIFTALSANWEELLELAYTHVTILEEKVYSAPDDETRAGELWTNNYRWLKVEKLVGLHFDNIKVIRENLLDLTSLDSPETLESWLEGTTNNWERLSNIVQEDLVKPTANLADLMYKSVGFRDSRLNLQLSTSVWRLTWIATTFLPLTFVVGFFGMNVDTFHDDPSIKWYFIVAVPLMVVVVFCWWIVKHILHSQLQNFTRRSVYSNLFSSLSTSYPSLWTPSGPRNYVFPQSFASRIKWRLIHFWSDPSKTINAGNNTDDDGLGTFSRIRRGWMQQWTEQLALEMQHPKAASEDSSMLEVGTDTDGALAHGISAATDLLTIPGAMGIATIDQKGAYLSPDAANMRDAVDMRSRRSSRSLRSEKSNDANSAAMVEEKGSDWLRGPFKKPREYGEPSQSPELSKKKTENDADDPANAM